jgi:hypothetical protein
MLDEPLGALDRNLRQRLVEIGDRELTKWPGLRRSVSTLLLAFRSIDAHQCAGLIAQEVSNNFRLRHVQTICAASEA